MDKLEELYYVAFNSNCFEEAYKRRVYDLLGEVEFQQGTADTDSLLLSLTVVQKLYQRLETVQCPYLRIITDGLFVQNSLIDGLLKCLSHRNQHIVFSTTKAIVQVFHTLPRHMIKVEWIGKLFTFSSLGQQSDQPWKKLYTMEILRKVLKHSRDTQKRKTDNTQQQVKNPACHCQQKADHAIYNTVLSNELAELFLESVNLEHILFYYIPFVVRPNGVFSFMKSCRYIGTAEEFVVLQASLKLGDAIHDQENVKRDTISGNKENSVIAFLHCIMEIAKYLQDNITPQGDTDVNPSTLEEYSLGTNSTECTWNKVVETRGISPRSETRCEIRTEETAKHIQITSMTISQLCTVLATLIQYLHYPRLPSLIFKKILEILNQVLVIPSSCLFGQKSECVNFEKIKRSSSISLLSVVECCLLDKIPKCSGIVGFCGTEVKTFSGFSSDGHDCTDVVALRTASLVLVKSSFVVLKSFTKPEGSSLFQKLSLSCVCQWCSYLLSLVPDILANSKTTKQSSSQREFQPLLVALFVDQDDDLVEVLLLLLLLYQEIQRTVPCSEVSTQILHHLNPHLLFVAFVQSIEFDHSVLLDLLISSETRFLEYIVQYLHLLVGDWKSFIQCLESFKGRCFSSEEETTGKDSSSDSLRELDSVSDFSENSTESHRGSEGLNNELNPREDELFLSKQGRRGVGEGVVWDDGDVDFYGRLSSHVFLEPDSCFNQLSELTCQKPEFRRSGIFSWPASEAMPSAELYQNQPDFDALGKEHRTTEVSGLESIVVAYSSSEESDMEIEDESENANAVRSDHQSVRIGWNNGDTNKGKLCQFPSKKGTSFDTSFTNANNFPHCTDNANANGRASPQKRGTKLLISKDENTVCFTYDCQNECQDGTSAVFTSTMLDKIMSMLIRLRMSVARLSSGGHFPYSVTPLITLMENAEKCYDGC